MKTKTTILVLSAFFLLNFFAGAQTFDKAASDSLLILLEQKNKAMGSLAVMENGKPLYAKAIGYVSLDPRKNADINTKYRIGSISKMFTATLIFQLIEEDKLSLDTKLDKFFPTVQNSHEITIGNMLAHRSGIHSITDDAAYQQYMTQPKTKKEIVALISEGKPEFNPGERLKYSNSNFILLGYIVEELRRQPYNDVLQKFICSRIGLKNTYYGGKPDASKNESTSFAFRTTWEKLPETDMSIPHGAGAVVSTPSDLVTFISSLFDGKLLKKESFDSMMDIRDGMGMGIQQFPYGSMKVYGHGGGIDGFNSLLCYLPESKVAVCYCSNGTV
ncbi:MAG TPA: serine hydrolase domain-containing protein, partial [Bacteroidales bacterium]|nr:serine hydrolase domain-containing protein [Bacteroidales bacterium]